MSSSTKNSSLYLLIGALSCGVGSGAAAPKAASPRLPKKTAAAKPPPAPPKGKAAFPRQKHRNPPGKIIKIFAGDKHLDPRALAAAPTAQQVAEKKRSNAAVQAPAAPAKPKKPAPVPKAKP